MTIFQPHRSENFDSVFNKYRVISFYTIDQYYKHHASRLIASLQRFRIPYLVQPVESNASWEATCSMKARFVYEQWKASNIPVVWLDADATVESELDVFETCNADFGIHKWSGHEFTSGTIYFGKELKVRALLERWVLRCDADPHTWDQLHLESAWADISLDMKLICHWLPRAYCQIFDKPEEEKAVIKHWQASRAVKAAGLVSGQPRLYKTEQGIVDRTLMVSWRKLEEKFWIEKYDGLDKNLLHYCANYYLEIFSEFSKYREKNLKVIDIGCGLASMANFFKADEYIGLDINPYFLIKNKINFPNHIFRISDNGLTYPENAELALCLNVLKYVSDNNLKFFVSNLVKNRRQVVVIDALTRLDNLQTLPLFFSREISEYIAIFKEFGFIISWQSEVILDLQSEFDDQQSVLEVSPVRIGKEFIRHLSFVIQ